MQGLMKEIWGRLAAMLKLEGKHRATDSKLEVEREEVRNGINRILQVSICTDTAFLRNVISALLYLIPDHGHSPFPDLKELFAGALKHKWLKDKKERPSMINIIPATGEMVWAEEEGREAGSLKELFEESLSKLPDSSIKAIRRVSLFRLIEQARPHGIQAEIISLMGLMIDILDQMMRDRIQRFHKHDPRSSVAHQQLMTGEERLEMGLPSATADLLPLMASQPELVAVQEYMKQRYDEAWEKRRDMKAEEIWPMHLPKSMNAIESDFQEAFEILIPNGMTPSDFFDDRYYLWGMINGAEEDRNTVLQLLQETNMGKLMGFHNPVMGTFEGNAFDIQLMSIPGFGSRETEHGRRQLLRGWINRVLMFMMPAGWFESSAVGERQTQEKISPAELWWMYGELKDALEYAEDLDRLLSNMFPGIEHQFLMKDGRERTKNERVRKRFERWGKATEEFFNKAERPEIAIVLETFFCSLAYKTKEQWEEANLFYHLKTAWQDLDDLDQINEARDEVYGKAKGMNATLRECKKSPDRLERMPTWLKRWREHDARFRLEVLEAVVKRDPRLENQDGKVVMDGASLLPFSPELPQGMLGLPVIRGAGQILWVWWPEAMTATL